MYLYTEKGFIMKYCTSSGLTQTLATDLGRPVDVMILTKNGQYLVAAVKGLIHVYNLETGIYFFTKGNMILFCYRQEQNHYKY